MDEVQRLNAGHQAAFEKVWAEVLTEMNNQKIFLKNDKQLNSEQKKFILDFFDNEVSANIVPLMVENIKSSLTLETSPFF
ncbi:hypothetical protein LWM68_22230 [Niabella sp. W65]|nr:hypothetical protein [Niabella sp. W65]MCH7365243.1 hypothetical protein [Niabella sp. W65]